MNTNQDWKPIESAPKDGTPVLLFARHISAEASTRVVGAYLHEYGWLSQAYSGQGLAQLVPSYWMDLPPFPGAAPSAPPLTVVLDPDPRGVSVGVYQGSSCVYNGAHPIPTGATGEDERQAFEAWAVGILGDNPTWRESGPCELAWQAWQARAPAAGDALARAQMFRHQLAHERAKNERLIAILVGIHNLTLPAPIEVDGKTYVFTPPEAVEILRGLSERIRAIPDEIAAIAQQKGEA